MTKKVVLDIETIPDVAAMARSGREEDGTFPPFVLHALACVSLLVVESDAKALPVFSIHSFSRQHLSERGIIASVERVLDDAFEVITFNGRGFDIPVLMTRAAMTAEPAPVIARLHAQRRYTAGLHVDLLEAVTGYGAAPRIRLHDLCSTFGIPSKIDVAGGDVGALVAAGEWARVVEYCETDVAATYLATQIWRGAERGAPELAKESWSRLAEWINYDQPKLEHLLPYAAGPMLLNEAKPVVPDHYAVLGW